MRVPAEAIVEVLDIVPDRRDAELWLKKRSWSMCSALIDAKKLSATALSQQSPERLMLATMPRFLSAAR